MTTETATQSGAGDKKPAEVRATPELNPRNAKMEEIFKARMARTEVTGELQAVDESGQSASEKPDGLNIQPEQKNMLDIGGDKVTPSRVAENSDDGEDDFNQDQNEGLVKVKINGKERLVLQETIDKHGGIRAYQSIVSANERFEQTAAAQKQLEQDRQQIERERAELRNAQQQVQEVLKQREIEKAQQTVGNANISKFDKVAFAKRMQEAVIADDLEELGNILEEVSLAGRQNSTPTPDVNQLVSAVTQQVERKTEQREAQRKFQETYSDILEDDELFTIADQRTLKLKAEHPDWGLEQILMEAGKQTKEWLAAKTGQQATVNRQDRKRSVSVMSGANARNAPPPEPQLPSRSEWIQQQKKARGQVV